MAGGFFYVFSRFGRNGPSFVEKKEKKTWFFEPLNIRFSCSSLLDFFLSRQLARDDKGSPGKSLQETGCAFRFTVLFFIWRAGSKGDSKK